MTNLPSEVFDYFKRDRSVLSEVFTISPGAATFRAGGVSVRVVSHEISGSFFPSLAVQPLAGRTIVPDDDQPGGASHVAVISYGFWSASSDAIPPHSAPTRDSMTTVSRSSGLLRAIFHHTR